MSEDYWEGNNCNFKKVKNPLTYLEEALNCFFDYYPEFEDNVTFIFTN